MKDDPDSLRKQFRFKEADFVRVNKPPSENRSVSDNPNDVPIDINELYRSAESPVSLGPKPARKPIENEVQAMLRENVEKANAAGLNEITARPKRKSKRCRDYLWSMFIGNLILIGCFFIMPIFAGAGIVIFNVGLTWIMWVVMSDY